MAKTHAPKDDEEKMVKDNIQKRFKTMFSGKGEPLSNMSISEVEALKARVQELEAQLEGQPPASAEPKPAAPARELVLESSGLGIGKTLADEPSPVVTARLQKQIGLWAAGISAAVGLTFFGLAVYIVFILQDGMWELSDKVLMPFTVLMFFASLVGWILVRRDRLVAGVWAPYLTNVVLGPVLVVLVLKDFQIIMGGYLALFSLLFIALIIPKASKLQALLASIGAALTITAIEFWDPAFRVGTSQIPNFTWMIVGPAALGIFALFLVARQLKKSGPSAGRSLTSTLAIAFFTMSAVILLIYGGIVLYTGIRTSQESLAARQQLVAQNASKTVSSFVQEKFGALETAVEYANPALADTFTRKNILESLFGLHPAFRQFALLDRQGRQLSQASRVSQSLSPQFALQFNSDLSTATVAGQRYISSIYIDDDTSEPLVAIAIPIQNVLGDYQATLAAELSLKPIWDLVDRLKVGETGYVYVVDNKGNLIAFEDTSRVLANENVGQIPEVQEFLGDPSNLSDATPELASYTGLRGVNVVGSYVPLGTPQWAVITELPTSEAYQPILRSLLTSSATIFLFAILVGLTGNFLARRLSAPLIELSNIATEISSGNLGLQAKVGGPNEIARLATTFNMMTSRLREFIGTLEQRVADRTHDLELASEVGRTATEKVTNLSEMLTEVAEMIRTRFDLYYTQIYLMDLGGEKITLRAGTGEVGKELLKRQHFLLVNSGSLNGRAVLEKQAQIVLDTAENPSFLPNELLPNTRSEISVPLMVGGNVVGVLDMQSARPGALSESNLPAFQALAGQLAIAVRNTALFTEAQEARAEVEAQMRRFTEQGWQDFLDAIQRGQKIAFAFDESQVIRLKSDDLAKRSDADQLHLPLMVTGAKIGEIQIPADPKHALTAEELEFIHATGAQLAQHLENLRLLAQAERYRAEAEAAVRRLTHEGWENFLQTHARLESGYTFDLTEVKPLFEKSNGLGDYALKQPMAVGDEVIGELAVNIPNPSNEEAEVITAIAQQLGGHLENLRLSELNEKHAQREQTLRQITSSLRSSNNPTTILRTAVRELGTIMGRRTVVQLVTPGQEDQPEHASKDNQSDAPAHQS